MNTGLKIGEWMSLERLAERMGGATRDEAMRMRWILCNNGYTDKTTDDVPDSEWLEFLDDAGCEHHHTTPGEQP